MKARVTRSKLYHRGGRVAWTWVYEITIEGHEYPYTGTGLGWVRSLLARKGATDVTYAWK